MITYFKFMKVKNLKYAKLHYQGNTSFIKNLIKEVTSDGEPTNAVLKESKSKFNERSDLSSFMIADGAFKIDYN